MQQPMEADPQWPELHRAHRAVLVLDVVESVRLMQDHEDDVIDRWRRFVNDIRTGTLPRHAGRFVKSLGDGMLLEFEHAPRAIAMAFEAHRHIQRYNVGLTEDRALRLRIGLHVDDVVADELDLYGSGVNLAARIAGIARPGGTAVSEDAVEELLPGVDAVLTDAGRCFLKHLKEPVHVFHAEPVEVQDAALATLPRSTPATTDAPADLSVLSTCVALVPFASAQGDVEQKTLCDLVGDILLTRLATVPQLRVISRLSTEQFRLRGFDSQDISRRTGATYLVSGRVHGHGAQCLLFLELIDSATEEVLWAASMHLDARSLFMPDEATTPAIAQSLVDQIMSHQIRRVSSSPLPNLTSQTLQFSAILLMHRRAQADFERSHDILEHLAERHPKAAAPHAWLAKWHVLRFTKGWSGHAVGGGEVASAHAQRALDLTPDSAMTMAMQAFVLCHMKRDLDGATSRVDDALQLSPNEPWAWLVRAVVESFRGDGDRAWHAAQQALRLSPMDPLKHYYEALAAGAAISAERYVEAERLAQISLSKDPNHLPTIRGLAIAQVHLGRLAAARETVGRVLRLQPDFSLERYVSEAPAGGREARRRWAEALREAGAPAR